MKPSRSPKDISSSAAKTGKVRPIPEGYSTITPVIVCKDTRVEVDFLERAFGAERRSLMTAPEGDRVAHAEVAIGSSVIMLGDSNPDMACGRSAGDLGGSPAGFFIYVDDVDQAFARAVKAGAEVKQEVTDMFWGDRAATLICPEGFNWTIATHTRDLTPEEIEEGQKAFFEAMKDRKGIQSAKA